MALVVLLSSLLLLDFFIDCGVGLIDRTKIPPASSEPFLHISLDLFSHT